MVARNVELGVVTGIRGNHRHASITCTGEAAHSGAVPRWLRRDAVFAVSEFIMRIDRHWQALLEQGQDLVVLLLESSIRTPVNMRCHESQARSPSRWNIAANHVSFWRTLKRLPGLKLQG